MRILLAAATLLLMSCGGSLAPVSGTSATATKVTPSAIATPTSQAQLLTVNAGGGNSSLPNAWSFQVRYPARYLVTDDWMVTPISAQGGIAPPRLAFTLESQMMAMNSSAFDLLKAGDRDCILIWSTMGFQSIGDWEQLVRSGTPGPVVSEHSQQISSFTFVLREVVVPGAPAHSFEAFVQLPQNLSYFFDTCKANSQADLAGMLPTFQVRTQ